MSLEIQTQEVLKTWNTNVKARGLNTVFTIKTSCRMKKFYETKERFEERKIAELLYLSEENGETILLWRNEIPMPDKVKGVPKHQVEKDFIDALYQSFLYECIGIFAITCQQSIKNMDYAEYDLINDRMKVHPDFEGMVIETLEDCPIERGGFYKKGDTFDVFYQVENGWVVYTSHPIGKSNNGCAKIPGNVCKVLVAKKVKLDII